MNPLTKEYDDFYSKNPSKWASEEHDSMVFDAVSHLNPKKVLDVGCGIGHTISYFEKRWGAFVNFTGIDLSPVAIGICKSRSNSTFVCVDICDFNVSKKYDLILLIGVAEHFIQLRKSFERIRHLLENEGTVFVEVPNCIVYPGSDGKEGYKRVKRGSRQVEWHYFRETWEKLFLEVGFQISRKMEGNQLWNQFQWLLTK